MTSCVEIRSTNTPTGTPYALYVASKRLSDVEFFELARTDHLDTLIFNICTRMGLQDVIEDSKFRKRVGINYSTTRLETLPNEWYAFIKVVSSLGLNAGISLRLK